MSNEERRRRRQKFIKGLIGASFYGPKKKPSKLSLMGRQIFAGMFFWIVSVPVVGLLFQHTPLAFLISLYAGGVWLFLMILTIRYFYYFAFKKDEDEK